MRAGGPEALGLTLAAPPPPPVTTLFCSSAAAAAAAAAPSFSSSSSSSLHALAQLEAASQQGLQRLHLLGHALQAEAAELTARIPHLVRAIWGRHSEAVVATLRQRRAAAPGRDVALARPRGQQPAEPSDAALAELDGDGDGLGEGRVRVEVGARGGRAGGPPPATGRRRHLIFCSFEFFLFWSIDGLMEKAVVQPGGKKKWVVRSKKVATL